MPEEQKLAYVGSLSAYLLMPYILYVLRELRNVYSINVDAIHRFAPFISVKSCSE